LYEGTRKFKERKVDLNSDSISENKD
jgi:hypothetical protein